jgi:DNA-binding LacI/PurR family transcriptional regulator
MYIVQQDLPVVANAKNLADGIEYALQRHGIDLPEDIVIAYSDDKQTMVGGKLRNGN